MPIDRDRPDEDLQHGVVRPRPAPRCYARPAPSGAVSSGIDAQDVALGVALGVLSCAALFLILNSGWSP
jgi:hypothetical protein